MAEDGDRADRQAVTPVHQHRIGGDEIVAIFLAPLAQRQHGRKQVVPLGGKAVFDPAAILGMRLAIEDAVFDQLAEPVGEDVAGDAQFGQEFLEMAIAVEAGAQDHEAPAFTHDFKRFRQTAFLQIA